MAQLPIELDDARRAVLARATPLASERVPLEKALGRCLAEDLVAGFQVQGFDNSAMDGFAVRAADTEGAGRGAPVGLRPTGESRAGHPSATGIGPGEAIAISTGAMLPSGADAVVRVEDTRRDGDLVLIEAEASPGLNLRLAGEDIEVGETVLTAGALLGPAELGVLASIGADSVRCHRRPRLAVLTSGDELVGSDRVPGPGEVRNSNSHSVPALARLAGAEIASVAWTPDRPEAVRAGIEAALGADVAIVCGGVSVGAHDHVKDVLAELGVEEIFWRVALKPGGPTWFGARGDTLVFGLPGNPVSVMVTFLLLARPALIALAGGRPERLRTVATLVSAQGSQRARTEAVRCRLELAEDGWHAVPAVHQGSHVLTSMLGADCLALIPAGSGRVEAGERVEVELLSGRH